MNKVDLMSLKLLKAVTPFTVQAKLNACVHLSRASGARAPANFFGQ